MDTNVEPILPPLPPHFSVVMSTEHFRVRILLVIFLGGFLASWNAPQATQAQQTSKPESPPTELPRIQPLSLEEALKAFEIAPGFRIELVAAEPLVVDPVAFAFDPKGRLVVVEMRGYSERAQAMEGRVRRLTDNDGDGRMDQVETVVEGLSWPTAVAVCEEGIIVAAAPDILLIPETSDGFQTPQILFRGLGKSNVQGLVNSLVWGLDLRLHGATSSSGGTVNRTPLRSPLNAETSNEGPAQTAPLPLGRRDFAIQWSNTERANTEQPNVQLEATDGGGQHGMMIDPWGDKYVCSNSDHLQQVWMLPERPWRAKQTSSPPPRRRSIAIDGPQADVFRASPVEPWRILRTHLRVTGQATGPIEGGGRAAGYFTGATGVYVYDGDQWGSPEFPIALVCDVGSNLVHRKRLLPDGLWNRGERIDSQTEFLRSTDIWFRPVQLGTGPDGALYIADMVREVIEHPASLPPPIKSQLDLNSGNDRGRIWRVVAESNPVRRVNDLSGASPEALALAIDHPNAWQRRTAARMIVQSSQTEAVPTLKKVVKQGNLSEGRVQAFATLATLAKTTASSDAIDSEVLIAAIQDPEPRVRQRAIDYGSELPEVIKSIPIELRKKLAYDPSVHVRFQLAWDARRWIPESKERIEALVAIASQDLNNPMITEAVEGSLRQDAPLFLKTLLASFKTKTESSQRWISAAIFQTLQEADEQSIETLVRWLDDQDIDPENAPTELFQAVTNQLSLVKYEPKHQILGAWFDKRLTTLFESNELASETFWVLAMTGLRWASPQRARDLLLEELHPTRSSTQQGMALRYLAGSDEVSARIILERWNTLTPGLPQLAIEHLSNSRSGVQQILRGLREGPIESRALGEQTRKKLSDWIREDNSLGELPNMVAGKEEDESLLTPEQYQTYEIAVNESGNIEAGRLEFTRVCASCHRIGDIGTTIGPELKSVSDKSPTQILQSILYPNREVDPRYRVVQIQTEDGRLIAGIIEDERENELQMLDGQGNRTRVDRGSIEVLRTLDRSLMPEELSKDLSPQQLRDLIAFLKAGT